MYYILRRPPKGLALTLIPFHCFVFQFLPISASLTAQTVMQIVSFYLFSTSIILLQNYLVVSFGEMGMWLYASCNAKWAPFMMHWEIYVQYYSCDIEKEEMGRGVLFSAGVVRYWCGIMRGHFKYIFLVMYAIKQKDWRQCFLIIIIIVVVATAATISVVVVLVLLLLLFTKKNTIVIFHLHLNFILIGLGKIWVSDLITHPFIARLVHGQQYWWWPSMFIITRHCR